ncbi:hypothetical protein J9312_02865 [Bacillus subtilis]|nr:hypothetical protein J9312_02865 [Bacillus subtilis]
MISLFIKWPRSFNHVYLILYCITFNCILSQIDQKVFCSSILYKTNIILFSYFHFD